MNRGKTERIGGTKYIGGQPLLSERMPDPERALLIKEHEAQEKLIPKSAEECHNLTDVIRFVFNGGDAGLKVIDEGKTNYLGNTVITFQNAGKVPLIWEWLDRHYHGYKFVIVMDCTKDEWQLPSDDVTVEFMGDVAAEAIECNDTYIAVDRREYEDFRKWRDSHARD